jgi:hypothetical protein
MGLCFHAPGMFVLTKAEAAAIAYRLPSSCGGCSRGVTDVAKARECARTIIQSTSAAVLRK